MFKRMVLLSRASDITSEQFRFHWSCPHAKIIKSIIDHFPDADKVRYTQNRIDRAIWQPNPSWPRYNLDGIVELHLTAKAAPDAVLSSGARDRMLEDEIRFLCSLTECDVEPEGDDAHAVAGTKFIFVAAKKEDVSEKRFSDRIRGAFAPGAIRLQGVRQLCINWVTKTSHRQSLSHEHVAPSVLVQLWAENIGVGQHLEEIGRNLGSVATEQAAYEIDPYVIL